MSHILAQHMRDDATLEQMQRPRSWIGRLHDGCSRGRSFVLEAGGILLPPPLPIIFNQPLLRKWQLEMLEFSAWLPLSPVPLLVTAVCLRRSSLSLSVRCMIVQPVAHILPAT